jgi:2-oxoglutarate dehydrogenase E2 component (dihydrolipoamide succinyltransferase)
MAKYDIVMPKMGEGIIEATIIRWLKNEGEKISVDDSIVEVATDKVDSEIPSPVEGVLIRRLFNEGDVVPIDAVVAVLEVEGEGSAIEQIEINTVELPIEKVNEEIVFKPENQEDDNLDLIKFISPLVRNIAKVENISMQDLNSIQGSGVGGRITKIDLENFLNQKSSGKDMTQVVKNNAEKKLEIPSVHSQKTAVLTSNDDVLVPMTRMRKLIAEHMVSSIKTSPHVTSIIDINMSKVVSWREKQKSVYLKSDNEKLTYTHIFVEVAAKALKEFPGINASVQGDSIVLKKNVNVGLATVLPDGNLIVPVAKNVDQKSLLGIVKEVNSLANRARSSQLQPDEIQGGTFTITNLGSFDTLIGTPIINQPQVAILAVGAIKKQVVVIEHETGDSIGIAPMMYMALTYDHRVVDGALGGLFLKRMKELLENYGG